MDKFRMSDGSIAYGDFTKDKEKLKNIALNRIDKIAKNDTGLWVELWCILENIFTKNQPSINQLKQDLKDNFTL